jgi:glutamyl-tRNA synthetase
MIRGRLAPSPTGALHLGNARTFLLAWLSIRAQSGKIVLRIEDLDGPRVKPETVEQAISDLRWLGLDWDEGPDVGGLFPSYVQTQCVQLYNDALERLRQAHLIYPCICTRSDIERAASAPHPGEEGARYPGTCRDRFASEEDAIAVSGRPPALRFRVEAGAVPFVDDQHGVTSFDVAQQVGDFVVRKGSGTAAYQLSVVVDDARMEISEVVRGDDLLTSTPRQLLLYKALELQPPRFRHIPLVVGEDGLRLAKRHGDSRIAMFRDRGVRPEQLIGQLAFWSGLVETKMEWMPSDLVAKFDWARVPNERIICDRQVLRQLLPE